MNLFAGGTVAEGMVHFPDFAVPLPDQVKDRVMAGQSLTVGVRPEALRLVDGTVAAPATMPGAVILRGVAEVVEPDFGRQSQLVYTANEQLRFVALGDLQIPMFAGHPVSARLDSDRLHFFDTASEQRIG